MTWQDLAVWAIVACAVAVLVWRLVGRRTRRKPAETFVPLSSLKSSSDPGRDRADCH
jgi:membrane protein implicated in regulation of membrane protease activity